MVSILLPIVAIALSIFALFVWVKDGNEIDKIDARMSKLEGTNTNVGTTDAVNHPAHYTKGGIECIDALKAATVGKIGIEAVCVANIIKYLWRYEEKNGIEDIRKAEWYLERLIDEVQE